MKREMQIQMGNKHIRALFPGCFCGLRATLPCVDVCVSGAQQGLSGEVLEHFEVESVMDSYVGVTAAVAPGVDTCTHPGRCYLTPGHLCCQYCGNRVISATL